MSLMLHCGGQRISKDELALIPVPEPTETYSPIPFIDIVNLVERRVQREFVRDDYDLGFGVSKDRQRMFGVLTLKNGESKRTPAIGFRSSLDKSLRPAVCGGGRVTVCDNLLFSGDFFNVQRTQTGKAWEDFELLVMGGVAKLEDQFGTLDQECEAMEDVFVGQRTGWEEIGVLWAQRYLNGSQARRALNDWNDKFENLTQQSAFGLYNSVTVALKKGNPSTLLKQYTQVHRAFQTRFLQGGVGSGPITIDLVPHNVAEDE